MKTLRTKLDKAGVWVDGLAIGFFNDSEAFWSETHVFDGLGQVYDKETLDRFRSYVKEETGL